RQAITNAFKCEDGYAARNENHDATPPLRPRYRIEQRRCTGAQRYQHAKNAKRARQQQRHVTRARICERTYRVRAVLPSDQAGDQHDDNACHQIAAYTPLSGAGCRRHGARHLRSSARPMALTAAASRAASAARYLPNSGASRYWIGESTFAIIPL